MQCQVLGLGGMTKWTGQGRKCCTSLFGCSGPNSALPRHRGTTDKSEGQGKRIYMKD